jgi:hypothetical protein
MRKLLVTISLLSIILFSCQKEVDFVNGSGGGGGGGTTAGLLSKLVSKSGTDSSILAFGYNSSKKLITLSISDMTGEIIQQRAERNAQGIIQKVIIKSDIYQQVGLDSIITVVTSNGGRYISEVTTFDLFGFILKDSIALIYDGTGKVITEKSYTDVGIGIYEEVGKVDYTYSGNNVSTIKNYSYDASTGTYTLEESYTYDQYDNKVSPIYFGMEAFVFGSPFFISSNNPTKSTITYTGSPIENYTTTYTYNTSNKPLTATSLVQPGNTTTTATYYYQ